MHVALSSDGASLARGAAGNIRTETLRAFTEAEFRQITAVLP